MDEAILLLDVGGTNTRAKILTATSDLFVKPTLIAERMAAISDTGILFNFISALVADYNLMGRLKMAVLCCAGPVTGHTRVIITNWIDQREISYGELVKVGLPQDKTILLNDMEAASHYLIAVENGHTAIDPDITSLYSPLCEQYEGNKNKVLMVPGTGIGIAAIVSPANPQDQNKPLIIPCELQHAAVPALDPEHAELIKAIAGKYGKDKLSWEDFISGKALENIYKALADINKNDITIQQKKLTAEEIAESALVETNDLCTSALTLYYRCAGALAQVLALTFQPYAGIYLAGTTSKKNAAFIQQSEFLTELHHNDKQKNLLKRFPVYLIEGDLNLYGAAYLASQHLKEDKRTLLFA